MAPCLTGTEPLRLDILTAYLRPIAAARTCAGAVQSGYY